MADCDLRNERGRCKKAYYCPKCENVISDESWFEDRMSICGIDQVCRKNSIFGNDYFFITESDIEALKNGKVLYAVDEYGTFIMYKQDTQKEATQ